MVSIPGYVICINLINIIYHRYIWNDKDMCTLNNHHLGLTESMFDCVFSY